MSENKEYVIHGQSGSTIHISEETICTVAAMAAVEVQGVIGLSHLGRDISENAVKKNLSRAIRLHGEESTLIIELSLVMDSSCTITDVAANVQNAVQTAVEDVTGIGVSAVNIRVSEIALDT